MKRIRRQRYLTFGFVCCLLIAIASPLFLLALAWMGQKIFDFSMPDTMWSQMAYGAFFFFFFSTLLLIFARKFLEKHLFSFFYVLLIAGILLNFAQASGTNAIAHKDEDKITRNITAIFMDASNALAALFPSRGAYEIQRDGTMIASPGNAPKLPLNLFLFYAIFHVLVYVFFAVFALKLFGQKVIAELNEKVIPNRNKNVFWCENVSNAMITLAKDIYDSSYEAQIIFNVSQTTSHDINALYRQMEELGFVLKLFNDEKIDCVTAPRHFFITDDFAWNVSSAQRIIDARTKQMPCTHGDNEKRKDASDKKKNNASAPDASFYVRTSDMDATLYHRKWADHIRKQTTDQGMSLIDIRLLNESELIARKLIKDHPMLECPGISINSNTATVVGNFKVLLLGLGGHGREILRRTVCDAQYIHENINDAEAELSVDVVDISKDKLDFFFETHPAARHYVSVPEVAVNGIDTFSGDFFRFLKNSLSSYNRIIVCLGNDDRNLSMAANIVTLAKRSNCPLSTNSVITPNTKEKHKLFVVLNEKHRMLHEIKDEIEACTIGEISTIYTQELVISESQDLRGKIIDHYYRGGGKYPDGTFAMENIPDIIESPAAIKWHSDTNYFNQMSSRAAADGLQNYLKLLNLPAFDDNGQLIQKNLEAYSLRLNDEKILDTLAETEHKRWMAFHFMQGITTWENPSKAEHHKPNDVEKRYRHAALVPFDKLPEIDKVFGLTQHLQQYDRNIVKELHAIYKTEEEIRNRIH